MKKKLFNYNHLQPNRIEVFLCINFTHFLRDQETYIFSEIFTIVIDYKLFVHHFLVVIIDYYISCNYERISACHSK